MLQNMGHIAGWIAVLIILGFSFRVVGEDEDGTEYEVDDEDAGEEAEEDDGEDPDTDGPDTGLEDTDEEAQDEDTPADDAPAPGAEPAGTATPAGSVKPAPPKVSSYLTDDDRATIRHWREQGMDEDDIQVAIAETVATRREAAREASEFYIEVERRENPEMIDELRPWIRRALARYTPDVASTQAGVNQAIAQALLDACAVDGGEHKPLHTVLAKFVKGAKNTAAPEVKPARKPSPPATRVPTNSNSGNGRATSGAGAGRVSEKLKELYG
jgi:hypothetical protein